ncbi:hypothetical protein FGE12_27660 [Aggregicoccus sp. 17bor-14]|uniref:hypothetical protein n=1 Tax=Myxococcaceae TaxID=31 RepID=UPI00129CCC15|nr:MULTISPECIES: hypothetical protein [Myxococcaceae]MBF5046224.1 hypothetical protein [Simulacricoccus sp. 17bor-14]MRI91948.1 hypothetical protein [Aggregicoccus sp. 17bor-14]
MPPNDPRLQHRLERLLQALDEGEQRQARVVEQWTRHAERHNARHRRRERRRRRERGVRDRGQGVVYLVVAVLLALFALTRLPQFWWMLFIVLGLGKKAAYHLTGTAGTDGLEGLEDVDEVEAEAVPAPMKQRAPAPPPPPAEDERPKRVDALCERLLQSFKSGPAVLQEVVQNPERTVEALRRGCHELLRREAELRALQSAEEVQRLDAERVALAARVEGAPDAVARERLAAALALLDQQREQRRELGTAADRLEAEYTRLYYTLENLHAQVLRARSADALAAESSAGELRASLEKLGDEVDAVADALEGVHRGDLQPISEPPPESGPGGSRTRTRE